MKLCESLVYFARLNRAVGDMFYNIPSYKESELKSQVRGWPALSMNMMIMAPPTIDMLTLSLVLGMILSYLIEILYKYFFC
jgi:hypothetical protein